MNFIDRYQERRARTLGRRGDLYFAEGLPLSASSARVLVGFEPMLGPPSARDIDEFVTREFQGELLPQLETLRIHDREGGATLVVERRLAQVPLREAAQKGMVEVTPLLYRQADTGQVWEVRSAEGAPMLVRREQDDIGALMAERKARQSFRAASLRFDKLVTAGRNDLAQGDEVRFYSGQMMLDGTVSSVGEDQVTVSAMGKSHKVPREAILEVLHKGDASRSAMESKVRGYFKDFFGAKPELATEISKTSPPEPGASNAPAKLSSTEAPRRLADLKPADRRAAIRDAWRGAPQE